MIKKLLFRKKIEKRYDRGNLYSLFQIIKYFVWIIAILIMLEELGLKLNALLAGSAALLVGIGLGLQNTFNNLSRASSSCLRDRSMWEMCWR